jgi:hypothetical protein
LLKESIIELKGELEALANKYNNIEIGTLGKSEKEDETKLVAFETE